jgi:ribonuclease R
VDVQALRRDVFALLAKEKRPMSRRAIVRKLGLDEISADVLKRELKGWEAEGLLGVSGRRGYTSERDIPPVSVVDFTRIDDQGDLIGEVTNRRGDLMVVRYVEGARAGEQPGPGNRALCRLDACEDGTIAARLMKLLPARELRAIGAVEVSPAGLRIVPTSRKQKEAFSLSGTDARGAEEGDIVAYTLSDQRRHGLRSARVIDIIGKTNAPDAPTALALAAHGIVTGFNADEEREVGSLQPVVMDQGYADWSDKPFITIDPEDARDHDDAVFAEADAASDNSGGFYVHVAIADVAAYVTPGGALDRGARERGNSVYFPDRVVPMLPEKLSTDLCSLIAGQERPALCVSMRITAEGRKLSHRFTRARIRLVDGLSYERAQRLFDAEERLDDAALQAGIETLWAAYQAMARARERRQPLAIETSERKIHLNTQGEVTSITRRQTLPANKLIEEMMVQANVCAAETLEGAGLSLILRVHDEPSREKLQGLSDFLRSINLKWTAGERVTPARFNRILEVAKAKGHGEAVNDMVLRSQAQAQYSTGNIGHFGLNLGQYAHFTSPIRRYADLTVHRALLVTLKQMKESDLPDLERLRETSEHISSTERTAMAAERDAQDCYLARYMSGSIGTRFSARISGVTKAGIFVRLDESGADGLVPLSLLGAERFRFRPAQMTLMGEQTKTLYRMGQTVEVTLLEATPLTGGLLFSMLPGGERVTGSRRHRQPPRPTRSKKGGKR